MEREHLSTSTNGQGTKTRKNIAEEALILDLERNGINYLTHNEVHKVIHPLSTESLIFKLIQQPTARVRNALIPLLLAHPEYSLLIPDMTRKLKGKQLVTLKNLYTAAVYLQQRYLPQ